MEYKYVSFDIADQSFKFYTGLDWHNLIANAEKSCARALVRSTGPMLHWKSC